MLVVAFAGPGSRPDWPLWVEPLDDVAWPHRDCASASRPRRACSSRDPHLRHCDEIVIHAMPARRQSWDLLSWFERLTSLLRDRLAGCHPGRIDTSPGWPFVNSIPWPARCILTRVRRHITAVGRLIRTSSGRQSRNSTYYALGGTPLTSAPAQAKRPARYSRQADRTRRWRDHGWNRLGSDGVEEVMAVNHGCPFLGSLAVVLAVVGCGDGSGSSPAASSVGAPVLEEAVNLPTNDWAGGVSEEALVGGTLAVDSDGCVFQGGRAGRRVYATWPAGFSASIGSDGVRLFDTDGVEVATEGETVEMSGGYHEPPESHRCLPAGGAEIAVVQSQATVTARGTETTA